MGQGLVEQVLADGEVEQGAAEPLAVGPRLGWEIAQAAATFPLT
jgi:hypothetical protein